jgi:hypothetical protein
MALKHDFKRFNNFSFNFKIQDKYKEQVYNLIPCFPIYHNALRFGRKWLNELNMF